MEILLIDTWIIYTVVGFLLGSIPFSLVLGRLFLRTDIRAYGDRNPGAANVVRAGSKGLGIAAVLLDGFKGCIPVALAVYASGVSGWAVLPVTLAPLLGHAFSPFLRGHGGKGISTTFGVWTGLTLWEVPTVLGLASGLFGYLLGFRGWAVMLAAGTTLLYLVLRQADIVWVTTFAINAALLAWKYRAELRQPPQLRPAVAQRLGRHP
jgi:glycerol-3-phosphate acyltransferase PlsY